MTRSDGLPGLHATAVIDESATIADTASIGPYSVIGPDVVIGERARIGPHVLVERDTRIAEDVRVSKGAVLGTDPQDMKYAGERTFLEIGARTVIREFATLNRGTAATGLTVVGADALVMAYVHIAHDCRIGDHVVLANGVTMGGHVCIEDWAIVGGLTPIHQFVRVGCHAMVGGAARIPRDVAPFTIVGGSPTYTVGINRVGLERRGFAPEAIRALRTAFREVLRASEPMRSALERFERDACTDEVWRFVEFVRESERGIMPCRSGADEDALPEA